LSKETLYKFADYVQECYLFSLVNMISESVGKQIANDKKLYVIDNGLVNAISFKLSKDEGKLLENLVYSHLRKKGNEIYYFQGKNECDFVETEKNKVVRAVQVTLEVSGANQKREVNGLLQALEKYNLPEGYIITQDQNLDLETGGKKIFVRPAWEWLLKESKV
ncbi:MAG TPA: ATP-binding protein, partial [Bacteroidetes bacterium]|nr:ATP-binding protein [Bacteroidota bacterium]